jgi:small-conductance mechanosensitive channel
LRYFKPLAIHLLAFILLIISAQSYSAEKEPDLQKSFDQIKTQIGNLNQNDLKPQDLDGIQNRASGLLVKLDECVSTNTTEIESIQNNLKLLGPQEDKEESDIKNKRKELEKQIQAFDTELKRCNLLKVQLNQIIQDTTQQRQKLLKSQLLSKQISLWSASKKLATLDEAVLDTETEAILPLTEKLFASASWPLLFLAMLGVGIGIIWKHRGNVSPINRKKHASPTVIAALRGIKRTSRFLLALLFSWIYLKIQEEPSEFLVRTLQYSLLLIFTFALMRGVLFADFIAKTENKSSRRTILTASWIFILFSIFTYAFSGEIAGGGADSAVLYLIWLFSLAIAAMSFIIILWLILRIFYSKRSFSPVFLIPMGAMVGAIVTAILGYHNASNLLFFGTVGSIIILILAFLMLRVSNEFFDSLDEGKINWQHNLRVAMSIQDGRSFPGIIWLRILLFFTILFLSISSLMFIWGNSQQQISSTVLSLKDGLKFGTVNLDLLSILYAILILVVSLSVLPFIKNNLVTSWLKHSNLSRGATDAIQTLVGYGGVAIAILWALFVLGLNFKNVAIVAGALSVGIGFGLQNIVNNFVSGLILLFERPIRRGDWIVVGNTEGYVRDISIRSTKIETFDRADVIVPNSELISNQVTNWMLSSNIGRLKAAVGVAYGSDVEKVMEVMETIADNHPEVISDHPGYPIHVLFLSFGDSALNFELRCYVKNVDNRLRIQSDINLSIDREFRKAEIEIPFPQRVVHMENKTDI